jgi:xanthine dehydrogenase YagS FAD-binding subunit
VRAFELHQPASVAEAVELLVEHGPRARPLAGGTDLVAGMMRDQIVGKGLPYPTHLVDVARIRELSGIEGSAAGVVVGAATTLVDLGASDVVDGHWPLLTAAARGVASPEIRSVGTLGGNIHQRPRCWFFRNRDFDCAKKGGDICYAVKGDNRYNAILGGNLCFIVHPSDTASALVALEARAVVAGPGGRRIIPFADYFIGPDEDLLRETVLDPDELLVAVELDRPAPGTVQVWAKVNEKGAPTWDFAIASVALATRLEGGVWQDGRIVLGGVAPVPYRAASVEAVLAGRDVRSAIPDALAELDRIARPMRHNGYKVAVARDLLERSLGEAVDRAGHRS